MAYHIEIALAGVEDKENLVIQWMSPRTLLVQGNIPLPDVGHGKPAEGDRLWEGDTSGWAMEAKNQPKVSCRVANPFSDRLEGNTATTQDKAEDSGELRRVYSNDEEAQNRDVPLVILNERKVGPFQRTVTLPPDVNMRELKAKLEYGLLRVDIPKRDMSGEPKMKVEIEW